MENETVTITKSQIVSDLEAGLSRKEMRTKYSMSIAQLATMMDSFGLKGAKRHGIRKNKTVFNFINDIDGPDEAEIADAAVDSALADVEHEVTVRDEENVFSITGSYDQELEDFI